MATTTISLTSFKTACAECADAIASNNYSLARTKYAVAEAINAGLMVETQSGEVRMRRKESLESLEAAISSAEKSVNSVTDQHRIIRTRVSL